MAALCTVRYRGHVLAVLQCKEEFKAGAGRVPIVRHSNFTGECGTVMTQISKTFFAAGYTYYPHRERMTKKALKTLLKEVFLAGWKGREKLSEKHLEEKINKAVLEERDQCARLCDDMRLYCGIDCADAIRRRR